MVGKIQRVDIRKEMFRYEDRNFTTWMEQNIDELNNQLGLQLTCTAREQRVGSFSLDIEAEDSEGQRVIIENQLEKSDHDHLGKLITYLSNLDAKTAIWITTDPRPEHVNAITWLNESYAASFYLVKLEGIRIGDSEPAPLFTTIVGPSEESRDVGALKKEEATRHTQRREFWGSLQKNLSGKTILHANLTPSPYNWWSTTSGVAGLGLSYLILKGAWAVELYIDRGKDSEEENLAIFDTLYSNKEEIESSFGQSLDWQKIEGKRACKIRYETNDDGGLSNEEKWPVVQNKMIEYMIALDSSLRPYLSKIN